MHELSLVSSLCAKAEAVAVADGASRVTAISVRLGALAHLSPEHLREHLARAAVGTMLEGAHLNVIIDDSTDSPAAQDIELLTVEVE